ncbi:hypothetical protein OE810_01175 [Rhodobacteraceae bacterium XHP0102]|nr:hypothetical protein [Rhodobacteraceae bacterium XHP0102]
MEKWEALVGGELLPAEVKTIDACRAGLPCTLGNGRRPEGPDPARTIRAEVLRALITGGVEGDPTHDRGVHIKGAYVAEELDLSFATAKGGTGLFNCRFEHFVAALNTSFEFLNLGGSALPELIAQGARVTQDVFLRTGFHATGEVNLYGAVIGGQLVCTAGRFENANGYALNAQGARVTGDVFLSGDFHATGEVSLSGAVIGGQLSCVNGTFEKANGNALNAQHLVCNGALVFRDIKVPEGYIDFSAGHVGALRDRVEDWPEGGRVILDGFTYDRIIAAATTGKIRLNWLSKVDRGKKQGFKPQPYTQLAKVLRAMGHERAAKDVLVARDRKIAAEEWKRARQLSRLHDGRWAWFKMLRTLLLAMFSRALAYASHLLIDYGHRPLKAIWSLFVLWGIAAILAAWAWRAGDMVPNSDVILTSANWADSLAAPNPAEAWATTPEGQSWETFNRYAWAADVVIPILDFGQTQAWAPTTSRGWAGYTLWWGKWALSSAGWIILAFAAAGVTGVARRED